MKAYCRCISNLLVAVLLSNVALQTVLAADMAEVTDATGTLELMPGKELVFTAGAVLTEGYKSFRVGGEGEIFYSLYDANGSNEVQLPTGLNFDKEGVIRGTVPLEPQRQEYTIKVLDQGGNKASKKVVFQINPALAVRVDRLRLTAGANFNGVPLFPLKISGGTGKTTITYLKDGAPVTQSVGGLYFAPEGGITGNVPNNTAELDGMAVRVEDEGGGAVVVPLTWNISAPLTARVTGAELTAGARIPDGFIPVQISGGTAPIMFKLHDKEGKPAVLPDAIVFNEINGSLEGRVNGSAALTKNYVIKASDHGGGVLEVPFKLKINKPS